MRFHTVSTATLMTLFLTATLPAQPPDQKKVMITEVCPYTRQVVELTNFDDAPVNLNGYVLRWRSGNVTYVSSPLNFTITRGEIVVVVDPTGGSVNLQIPSWIRRFFRLPALTVPFGASVTVALADGAGIVTDEVRILGLNAGETSQGSLGGMFRGLARPGQLASGAPTVERIWGLDSDSAGDWCRAVHETMGRENSCSGPRTTDPVPVQNVVINEVDERPHLLTPYHCIELHNRTAGTVDLREWYLLVSGAQSVQQWRVSPWTVPTPVPAGAYVVIWDSPVLALPPSEMPLGTLAFHLSGQVVLGAAEYSIALYDPLGRLVDLVRSTVQGTEVVHNHPRAPAAWNDFRGAARRPSGSTGIGRTAGASDTNTGADWRPTATRSMGFANPSFVDGPGDGPAPDARLHEGGEGDGLTLVVNAGAGLAGARFYLLFSTVRSNGQGPILGLAADCLPNFITYGLANIAPAGALLDDEGSFRFELPWHSLPAGVATDNIAVVSSPLVPYGAILTRVLEFDT